VPIFDVMVVQLKYGLRHSRRACTRCSVV